MAFVKNPILLPLQNLIGLAPAPHPLILDDQNISLTLPLIPDITRRSRTQAPSTGLYSCQMQTEHSAAGSLTTVINPYAPQNPGAIWPSDVPEDFDAWVIGANIALVDGDIVDLDDASLEINPLDDSARGWTVSTGGGAIAGNLSFTQIAHWDQADMVDASRKKGIWRPLNLRFRRGDRLQFITKSNLAGDLDIVCAMIWALFPAGLGQDAAF